MRDELKLTRRSVSLFQRARTIFQEGFVEFSLAIVKLFLDLLIGNVLHKYSVQRMSTEGKIWNWIMTHKWMMNLSGEHDKCLFAASVHRLLIVCWLNKQKSTPNRHPLPFQQFYSPNSNNGYDDYVGRCCESILVVAMIIQKRSRTQNVITQIKFSHHFQSCFGPLLKLIFPLQAVARQQNHCGDKTGQWVGADLRALANEKKKRILLLNFHPFHFHYTRLS